MGGGCLWGEEWGAKAEKSCVWLLGGPWRRAVLWVPRSLLPSPYPPVCQGLGNPDNEPHCCLTDVDTSLGGWWRSGIVWGQILETFALGLGVPIITNMV